MKIDPYKHEERYLSWKEKTKEAIPDISNYNSKLIKQYLNDMENGINICVTNKKGARSYIRLNALRHRLIFLVKQFETRFKFYKVTDITEERLFSFFADMRNGKIKRKDKKKYKSVQDYVKIFKAFWHWHQKVNRKNKIDIPDITIDLDSSGTKPEWVYLDEKQVKEFYNKAKYEYRVLIMFLFDSGIRSPTELINVKVSDLYSNCKELHIREEISKTFGRKIKLMLCSELLREYIKQKELKSEDYLFPINPYVVNRYLKRFARQIFGDKKSLAGQKYSELTMYDFRHISCCYWLPRYKSESALKYRFGWKKSDKIHYYSEMLGMKDTISEEDLLIDVTKTEIEKRLVKTENDNEVLKEKVKLMNEEVKELISFVNKLRVRIGDEKLLFQAE